MKVEEIPLYGGAVDGRVVRVGETVRRPAGPWTPAIQSLLAHLESEGFPSPRPLGLDDQGRECVSFLPGEAGLRPWPDPLRTDEGAYEVGALLALYHRAVSDYRPSGSPVWRHGAQALAADEIVLHGDFAPFNLIYRDGRLAGVIDFELARPGRPLEDAAFCVIRVAHLRPDSLAAAEGFDRVPDRRARFLAFADGLGVRATELAAAVIPAQREEGARMARYAAAGLEPWTTFVQKGFPRILREELGWLERCFDGLALG